MCVGEGAKPTEKFVFQFLMPILFVNMQYKLSISNK